MHVVEIFNTSRLHGRLMELGEVMIGLASTALSIEIAMPTPSGNNAGSDPAELGAYPEWLVKCISADLISSS